jgi:hypothetical protein
MICIQYRIQLLTLSYTYTLSYPLMVNNHLKILGFS